MRKKYPWRYKVKDILANFWGTVAEGLNAMAYGTWLIIREALLPLIAAPTTLRRIAECKIIEGDDKGFVQFLYAIANFGMIIAAIASFANGVAIPATVLWLITNFLSLAYELGESRLKKK